ncbi:MAG: hypothetical protein ACO1PB_04710 [Ramlibacter sp.]
MVVVMIHWRIKSTDDDEKAFFEWWSETATIAHKSGLIGEFLSAPIPANKFDYKVDDLTFGHGVLDCRHFMNIGLWKDEESFKKQVGDKFNDNGPIMAFEADRRTRTILSPKQWRRGQSQLPDLGSCE